jgi:transposase
LLWVHRQQFLEGGHPLGVRRIQPPTAQEGDDRQLTALRVRLTKKRTAVLNGIHTILRKHNLEQECPTKVFQTKKVRRWLAELELPGIDSRSLARSSTAARSAICASTRSNCPSSNSHCGKSKSISKRSMPGMGHYSAVAIASRIGDIERFKRPDSLANYFGLTPACGNSGEATQRLGSITKRGSKIVRYLLGQAVIRVLRFDGAMRTWFKRIKRRRGAKIARVAVMRRMATIIWHMLKRKQKYRYEVPIKKHREFEAFEGNAEATQSPRTEKRTEDSVCRGASPEPPKDLARKAQRGVKGREKKRG